MKRKLQAYFEDNITSYSYLFFAGAIAAAYRGYLAAILDKKVVLSVSGPYAWVIWQILGPLLFVLVFFIASVVTYKPKFDTFTNFVLVFLNITVFLLIITFAPVG